MKHDMLSSGDILETVGEPVKQEPCPYTLISPINHDPLPVKCSQCKKSFATEDEKFAHRLVHHHQTISTSVESPRSFSCKLCKKHFSSHANLWKHDQTHRGDTSNFFRCSTCAQTFSQQANLQRHQLVHTKEKPFKCTVCGKSFSQQSNVVKHQVTHTKEKKFQCKICSKHFTQLANMQRHQGIHANIRPFLCNICEKSYTQLGNLKKHLLTHNKVKKSPTKTQPTVSNKHPTDTVIHFDTCHRTTAAQPVVCHGHTTNRQTTEFSFVLDELLKVTNETNAISNLKWI